MLETMSKGWKSVVYGFYKEVPEILYIGDNHRRCHAFKCLAKGCEYISHCFMDTKDKASTGNLVKHAKLCWGKKTYELAKGCHDIAEVRSKVTGPINSSGSISAGFKPDGNGKVTYSHKLPTKTEIKFVSYLRGFF